MRTKIAAYDVSSGRTERVGRTMANVFVPDLVYQSEEMVGTMAHQLNIRVDNRIIAVPVRAVVAALKDAKRRKRQGTLERLV